LRDARRLRSGIGEFLRALGNYGANRQLSITDLQSDKWRSAAAATFKDLFADARLDLTKTTGLIIVPDDVLWYLPFEALVPDGATPQTMLADSVAIRYGPTAALAIGSSRPLRRPQRTAIVANPKSAGETAPLNDEMLQELEKIVSGPLRVSSPLPEPPHLVAPLLDELFGFDDLEMQTEALRSSSALPRSRAAPNDLFDLWFALPYGGPERIVLTGFTTAAEQGLKSARRGASRIARPGDELFQSLCGLMADGARTILITRWRTGGKTNFELVREFARELPHASATEAWQRACLLARESPVEPSREPRLKRSDETGELPTADHPFFWTGYLLVDTSPRPEGDENAKEQESEEEKAEASNAIDAGAETADQG
jgi:hypothetical protein